MGAPCWTNEIAMGCGAARPSTAAPQTHPGRAGNLDTSVTAEVGSCCLWPALSCFARKYSPLTVVSCQSDIPAPTFVVVEDSPVGPQ